MGGREEEEHGGETARQGWKSRRQAGASLRRSLSCSLETGPHHPGNQETPPSKPRTPQVPALWVREELTSSQSVDMGTETQTAFHLYPPKTAKEMGPKTSGREELQRAAGADPDLMADATQNGRVICPQHHSCALWLSWPQTAPLVWKEAGLKSRAPEGLQAKCESLSSASCRSNCSSGPSLEAPLRQRTVVQGQEQWG